jgi:hypothetical protein
VQHTKEVLVGVTLTLAIAVIAGAIMGGSSISQAQSESLDIITVELKKASNSNALLSVKIKNVGDSSINGITGQLNFDTDGTTSVVDPFRFSFMPGTLQPGSVTTFVGDMNNSTGIIIGESFTMFVNGTTTAGEIIQDTAVATASRF